MDFLHLNLPPGVALIPWALPDPIPGMGVAEYRLCFDEKQSVAVRDFLAKLANEATEKALKNIDALVKLEEQNRQAQLATAMPQSDAQKLVQQAEQLASQEKFVPMNPSLPNGLPQSVLNPMPAPPAPVPVVVQPTVNESGGGTTTAPNQLSGVQPAKTVPESEAQCEMPGCFHRAEYGELCKGHHFQQEAEKTGNTGIAVHNVPPSAGE